MADRVCYDVEFRRRTWDEPGGVGSKLTAERRSVVEAAFGRRGAFRWLVLTLFAMLVIPGCGSDQVERADLRRWQTLSLPDVGVNIQMPGEAYNLQLHHRSTGIGDSVWFITTDVELKSASEFGQPDLPGPGDNGYDNEGYMAWLKWLARVSPRHLPIFRRPYAAMSS